jgi:hypothetical protein
MTNNLQVGQIVKYINGNNLSVYTGEIKKVKENGYCLILDNDEASIELWSAGYAVGNDIHFSQIKEVLS